MRLVSVLIPMNTETIIVIIYIETIICYLNMCYLAEGGPVMMLQCV